jgi:hypothetical protein
MVVGDLVEYLREHLALGYDLHELKLQLVRYGHSAKMVEEALDVLKKEALNDLPSPPLPHATWRSAHAWLLAPAVLFMLVVAIGLVVALLKNPGL